MSIYRKFNRVPADELHYFERQERNRPGTSGAQDDSGWLPKRKAKPYERVLATTAAWCAGLPSAVQPNGLCQRFPRIANALASGWRDADATRGYFAELLTDRRGGRKGFPEDVLQELHALKAFYESLHPREGWRRA
jgi:hypothetical protein